MPSMLFVRAYRKSCALALGSDEADTHEVIFGNRSRIKHGERIFINGLDGSPDVDDLVTRFEEDVCFGIIRDVVSDSAGCCVVGLIDMNALNWTVDNELGSL